jgi:hypothetical protein
MKNLLPPTQRAVNLQMCSFEHFWVQNFGSTDFQAAPSEIPALYQAAIRRAQFLSRSPVIDRAGIKKILVKSRISDIFTPVIVTRI